MSVNEMYGILDVDWEESSSCGGAMPPSMPLPPPLPTPPRPSPYTTHTHHPPYPSPSQEFENLREYRMPDQYDDAEGQSRRLDVLTARYDEDRKGKSRIDDEPVIEKDLPAPVWP